MFLSMQCFAVDSFEEAMKKHRGTSLTHIPEVKDGVSFFIPKTLTPTWEEGSKYGIVKVPKMSLKNHRGNTFSQKNFEGISQGCRKEGCQRHQGQEGMKCC